MKKTTIHRVVLSPFAIACLLCAWPISLWAQSAPTPLCISSSNVINNFPGIGSGIIDTIFTIINAILLQAGQAFYNGILANSDFKIAVNVAFLFYIVIYGFLVLTSQADLRAGEIVKRLTKMAIVYALLSSSAPWTFFYDHFGKLFIEGMNELITQFSIIGTTTTTPVITDTNNNFQLDPQAMNALNAPIGKVFNPKFFVAILSLFGDTMMGWIMALAMIWAWLEFFFLLLGALMTYVRAIIGLAFLFGIAPIFFVFLLFERTKPIFMGWINQVVTFAIQPIFLFAFLSFYISLISTEVDAMLYNAPPGGSVPDFCWDKWFSLGMFDFRFWRPAYVSGGTVVGDIGASPTHVSAINIFVFLILCNLGSDFCEFIETITKDIGQGVGGGVMTGSQVENTLTMGNGSIAGIAANFAGSGINKLGSMLSGGTGGPGGGGGGGGGGGAVSSNIPGRSDSVMRGAVPGIEGGGGASVATTAGNKQQGVENPRLRGQLRPIVRSDIPMGGGGDDDDNGPANA